MNSNEDKRLSKLEYFELREKRLKLIYKVLYVAAAIWIALLLSLSQSVQKTSNIPIYAFLVSVASMFIIQILKYAIMEFCCMKIIGPFNDGLMNQTETHYESIWTSFPLTLPLCGLALVFHYKFVEKISVQTLLYFFFGCVTYFAVMSVVKMFKKDFKDKSIKVLDIIGITIGSVAAYALSAVVCLIASSTV